VVGDRLRRAGDWYLPGRDPVATTGVTQPASCDLDHSIPDDETDHRPNQTRESRRLVPATPPRQDLGRWRYLRTPDGDDHWHLPYGTTYLVTSQGKLVAALTPRSRTTGLRCLMRLSRTTSNESGRGHAVSQMQSWSGSAPVNGRPDQSPKRSMSRSPPSERSSGSSCGKMLLISSGRTMKSGSSQSRGATSRGSLAPVRRRSQ
jgi:hypothetical protein